MTTERNPNPVKTTTSPRGRAYGPSAIREAQRATPERVGRSVAWLAISGDGSTLDDLMPLAKADGCKTRSGARQSMMVLVVLGLATARPGAHGRIRYSLSAQGHALARQGQPVESPTDEVGTVPMFDVAPEPEREVERGAYPHLAAWLNARRFIEEESERLARAGFPDIATRLREKGLTPPSNAVQSEMARLVDDIGGIE